MYSVRTTACLCIWYVGPSHLPFILFQCLYKSAEWQPWCHASVMSLESHKHDVFAYKCPLDNASDMIEQIRYNRCTFFSAWSALCLAHLFQITSTLILQSGFLGNKQEMNRMLRSIVPKMCSHMRNNNLCMSWYWQLLLLIMTIKMGWNYIGLCSSKHKKPNIMKTAVQSDGVDQHVCGLLVQTEWVIVEE